MKKSEVDFSRIWNIHQTLLRVSAIPDFKDLSRVYYIIDPQVRQCIVEYQGLHRGVRKTDFIRLSERDLQCEDYIRNRLKKMVSTYEFLMSFDKTYSKTLYNKNVKREIFLIEY